jgi:hypothetical protein
MPINIRNGHTASDYRYLAVYDPSAGFVGGFAYWKNIESFIHAALAPQLSFSSPNQNKSTG